MGAGISSTLRVACVATTVSAALLLSACSSGGDAETMSAGDAASSGEFDSMVVLGHSGATGYDSDPSNPGQDAPANSWATGTNPEVDSVYLRLLATHPALEGHNHNVAVSGSSVDELPSLARSALQREPLPDLFLIQTVDNDIRCDGTDPENYNAFGATLGATLDVLTEGAPDADVFIVSSPFSTVQNYTDVVATSGADLRDFTGDGPCDLFDPTGAQRPEAIAYLQDVIDAYLDQIEKTCTEYPHCRYDGGAFRNVVVTAADISPDLNHPTIAGHAKLAAAVWPMLGS